MLLLSLGCASDPACAPCPACEPAAQGSAAGSAAGSSGGASGAVSGGATLAPWEAELLAPELEALRAGVVARGEQGFGVCAGKDDCEAFVGGDAGELPLGPHILSAELDVPALGEGWQVRFDLVCDVTTPKGNTSTVDHSKTYKVVHTGPKRGYHLSPLWKIQSPHPQGRRDCKYSLTPLRPDGAEGTPLRGAYATPMPETP